MLPERGANDAPVGCGEIRGRVVNRVSRMAAPVGSVPSVRPVSAPLNTSGGKPPWARSRAASVNKGKGLILFEIEKEKVLSCPL